MVVIKGLASLEVTDCIRNGEISFETDSQSLSEAREQVVDALQDLEEYELDQQIEEITDAMDLLSEAYEEQYDLLDKYSEKWSEIASTIQHAYDATLASSYLGDDWVEQVLTGNDEEIYTAFTELFETNQDQLKELDNQITTTENIESLVDYYITAYKQGTITAEEAYDSIEDLLDQLNTEVTSGENIQNILNYLSQVNATEATMSSVLDGIQWSLTDSSSELLTNLSLYNTNLESIVQWQTTWDVMNDNLDSIKDYASDILDAIEDLDFNDYIEELINDLEDDDDDIGITVDSATISVGSGATVDYDHAYHDSSGYVDSGPGAYAGGLEEGIIGKSKSQIADDVITLGTKDVDSDAVPIFAHPGELVINPDQQSQILKNFELASFNPFSNLNTTPVFQGVTSTTPSFEVTIGDIILPDVTDPDGFAKAMGAQIQSAFRQTLGGIRF